MRIGEFVFDAKTGELSRGSERTRLPPQPARLLARLAERRGAIVTREEIRELLWPDVAVDFEASLHTCIRQIRSALADQAGAPRFIETVPRRGYRLIAEVVPGRRRVPVLSVAILSGLLLTAGWLGLRSSPPVRVAIMPFPEPGIAESLVAGLTHRFEGVEIVGPTTTEAYAGRVRELVEGLSIDYVLNARDLPEGRVLVELIRGEDGAHVWVRPLEALPAGLQLVERVGSALGAELH